MNEIVQADQSMGIVHQDRLHGMPEQRLRELEAQGVDLSLLAEQLRLTPTARIESMLRLRELSAALAAAGSRSNGIPSPRPDDR